MKKHHVPTEHYYIPLGLFLLNCCLVHFLFLLVAGASYAVSYKTAVGAAGLALIFTIAGKSRSGILLASLFYILLLLYPLLFS
ncbi:hypothetical protein EDD80_105236 [Anseongella ginsenosidimutans]|uniref:Uncharacterized protein n=1 Tax=Anseongella ginsenosidimutans TaxID=496056 RepID=A0A4R3KRP7_9SPHI|nr:hypothetical protein [Anseongella ginsenosidimutans]QEC53015.1 hypothetical protein FRZ59_12175 [Anseongella ginsenosidimutans]TCS87421.1 hypothetical protein EDD80_105236 [Anseongella ginsenosidimutans]